MLVKSVFPIIVDSEASLAIPPGKYGFISLIQRVDQKIVDTANRIIIEEETNKEWSFLKKIILTTKSLLLCS